MRIGTEKEWAQGAGKSQFFITEGRREESNATFFDASIFGGVSTKKADFECLFLTTSLVTHVVIIRKLLLQAMFSPDTNPYASLSLLNPRRRQRTTSEESVGFQHKPKRLRRTGLSSETFKPLADQKTNGYINHLESSPGTNGHVVEPRNQRHISVDTTSLSIRSKEASNTERGRKVARNQGSTELVRCPFLLHGL